MNRARALKAVLNGFAAGLMVAGLPYTQNVVISALIFTLNCVAVWWLIFRDADREASADDFSRRRDDVREAANERL